MPVKKELLKVPNYNVALNADSVNNKDWFKYFGDVGEGVKTLQDDLNSSVETLTTDLDTAESEIDSIQDQITNTLLPGSGTIGDFKFSFDTSDHGVWLILDGRTLMRSEYPELYDWLFDRSLLRVSPGPMEFGIGDGETSFTIPNPGGRAIVAAGAGAGLTPRPSGDFGGEEEHTQDVTEMPAHTHTVGTHYGSAATPRSDAGSGLNMGPVTVTSSSAGGGLPFNIMQPWGSINAFIKYV